jgi:uncharacterized protein YlzI (FlbEa/FlbD family)
VSPGVGEVLLLAAIELIALTQLDGRTAYVNPLHIIQLEETHSAKGKPNREFTDEVHCVIGMNGGKYITVRETCDEVRKLFIDLRLFVNPEDYR